MLDAKVGILFILTLFFLNNHCQRIECNWGAEYLCGDKCVLTENLCYCGRDIISFEDLTVHVCCNNGTCFKDMTDGSVRCNGFRQTWRDTCNGECKQTGEYGFTTIPCDDGEQCVEEIVLCKGIPLCSE